MYLTSLNFTLKIIRMINFLCHMYFTTLKKVGKKKFTDDFHVLQGLKLLGSHCHIEIQGCIWIIEINWNKAEIDGCLKIHWQHVRRVWGEGNTTFCLRSQCKVRVRVRRMNLEFELKRPGFPAPLPLPMILIKPH